MKRFKILKRHQIALRSWLVLYNECTLKLSVSH